VFNRTTVDPGKMGGVPCIRGSRIPVATAFGMVAEGMTETQILEQLELLFMNLESVREALDEGSIVVFERNRIRVRSLPIG